MKSMAWDWVTSKFKAIFMAIMGINVVMLLLAMAVHHLLGISKATEIDYRLEAGSVPRDLANVTYIDRSDIVELIREEFLIDNASKSFGVILGPSGTGKSHLARLTCNMYPRGCLYHEVTGSSLLPTYLAKTISMRLKEDANFMHIFLEKIGIGDSLTYYTLPDSLPDALNFVLQELANRAKIFRQEYHHMPCLFIDGVDLLAKKDSDAFVDLVNVAKVHANDGNLRIVLVTSEGHVMPLMDSTSSKSRMAVIVEVLDISDEDALVHLDKMGVEGALAERVVNLTGGRFIHLNNAAQIVKLFSTRLNESELFHKIKKTLTQTYVSSAATALFEYKEAALVMKGIIAEGQVDPKQLYLSGDNDFKKTIKDTIEGLVKASVLRYTAEGMITWHSRLIQKSDLDAYLTASES